MDQLAESLFSRIYYSMIFYEQPAESRFNPIFIPSSGVCWRFDVGNQSPTKPLPTNFGGTSRHASEFRFLGMIARSWFVLLRDGQTFSEDDVEGYFGFFSPIKWIPLNCYLRSIRFVYFSNLIDSKPTVIHICIS